MREGMAASAALHIILLLIVVFGLPQMARDLPEYHPPVPVDIVDVSELTNLSVEDSPTPADPTPPKPVAAAPKPVEQPNPKSASTPASKPPPPAPEPPKPEPVKETPPEPAPEKPVIAEDTPDEVPEPSPEPAPEEVETPPKPVPVPVAKPKPPPPKEQVAQKEPEKKQEPKKHDEKSDETAKTDDFLNSVLKNVASAPDQKAERQSKIAQDAPPTPMSANSNTGRRGDRLTISEQDALRRHVSQFWSPPVGARGAETMVVVVQVEMNPDRTVRMAQAVDGGRLSNDPFFRAAADSAVRAVLRASPLTPLPPEKYDEWRTIKITFDPREML